jgi:hypothetical protein
MFLVSRAVAEFIDPAGEDIVNSGIELSYWPAMPHGLATRIFSLGYTVVDLPTYCTLSNYVPSIPRHFDPDPDPYL